MTFFFVTDVNPNLRAGNYIHIRLSLHLAMRGHKVYIPALARYWKEYWYVEKNLTLIEEVRGVPQKVDLVVWCMAPLKGWLEQLLPTMPSNGMKHVYIALDYWEGWVGRKIETYEEAIVTKSELVFAVSPQLCEYLSKRYGRRVFWLPNAVEMEEIKLSSHKGGRKVITISSLYSVRSPEDFLKAALRYKEMEFFWVGVRHSPTDISYFNPREIPPNLHFLGEIGNDELGDIFSEGDIAVVQAGRYPFSYFADPTKWYLYHAAKFKIISLNTPHHARFPQFYPNTICGTSLVETLGKALEDDTIPPDPMPIHDWSHRAFAFERAIINGEAIYGYAEDGKFYTAKELVTNA